MQKSVYSGSVRMKIRKTFDIRAQEFFSFYEDLYHAFEENQWPRVLELLHSFEPMVKIFILSRDKKTRTYLSPTVISQIVFVRRRIRVVLPRLDNFTTVQAQAKREIQKILDFLIPAMEAVGIDKKIYMKSRRVGGIPSWVVFMSMNPSEIELTHLKEDDPQAYDAVVRRKENFKEIEVNVKEGLEKIGYIFEKRFVKIRRMRKILLVGIDPETKEEFVFDPIDPSKQGISVEEYRERIIQEQDEKTRLRKENKKKGVLASYSEKRMYDKIKDMRWDGWKERSWDFQGEAAYVTITDDLAKQDGLTKIYPTQELFGKKIIVGGRYKGVWLDDLVNERGRLVEGNGWSYDEKARRAVQINPGEREPFVTVTERKKRVRGENLVEKVLYLTIPGKSGKDGFSAERQEVRKLSLKIPSIEVVGQEGSRTIGVYFEVKDFAILRKRLKAMSISTEAMRLIHTYTKDMARAELATEKENLELYSAENLGGFKGVVGGRKFDLLVRQKQALAWFDANDNKGVCALETGLGKTITSIAMMQKMVRDGLSERGGKHGRFLYVAPRSLVGNMDKEIIKFIEEVPAEKLRDNLDSCSYAEFGRGYQSKVPPKSLGKFWADKEWDLAGYTAIFFDEAHNLLSLGKSYSKAAFGLQHPNKVCLTASPMEKEPKEAYILAAISNNIDLTARTPEGKQARREMAKFQKRFLQVVGGRVVGIKEDEDTVHDLQVWVKKNIFHGDKQDVEEAYAAAPPLKRNTDPTRMSRSLGKIYRTVAQSVSSYLSGMARKFSSKKEESQSKEYEKLFGRAFRPYLKILNGLSNYPDQMMLRLADLLEGGKVQGFTEKEIVWLKPLLKSLGKGETPESLRERSKNAGNPKLERAAERVSEKLKNGSTGSLLFTDDKEMVLRSALDMSKKIPGKHVAAIDKKIYIFENGKSLDTLRVEIPKEVINTIFPIPRAFGGEELSIREQQRADKNAPLQEEILKNPVSLFALPFTEKNYRPYPNLPKHPQANIQYGKSKWHKFVLDEIVSKGAYQTCSLWGPIYSTGQNLQKFDTVVHLDRDHWNSEEMKQRTARAWRQGQQNPVEEIVVDMIYDEKNYKAADLDPTLDTVRAFHQKMEEEVFEKVIRESQKVDLSKEYRETRARKSSYIELDRRSMQFMLSPYLKHSEVEES